MVQNTVNSEENNNRKKRKQPPREKSLCSKRQKQDLLDSITKNFDESILSQEDSVDDPDIIPEDEGIAEVDDEFEPESASASVERNKGENSKSTVCGL